MGIEISPQAIKVQLKKEDTNLREMIGNAYTLQERIQRFIDNQNLQGETYDSVKTYYNEVHLPVIRGFICYAEEKINGNATYRGYVGSYWGEEFQVSEDKLVESLNKAKRLRIFVEDKPIISNYKDTLWNLEAIFDRRIQKIYDYINLTNHLYSRAETTLNQVNRGINCIKTVAYSRPNKTFNMAMIDLSWNKELKEKWLEKQHGIEENRIQKVYNELVVTDEYGNVRGYDIGAITKLLLNPKKITDIEKKALHQVLENSEDYLLELLGDATDSLYQLPGIKQAIQKVLGFSYNDEEDYYYTREGSIQQYGGFMDFYDDLAPYLGMNIDDEVVIFEYDGKEYRLEFWKGGYGIGSAFGGEIGMYYRDVDNSRPYVKGSDDSKFLWYECLPEGEQLPMKLEIYDTTKGDTPLFTNDTEDYAENGDHFWNLGIKTDSSYKKENIETGSYITVEDDDMRAKMVEGIEKNDKLLCIVKENVVYIEWKGGK